MANKIKAFAINENANVLTDAEERMAAAMEFQNLMSL